jgi:release factor glutamine methyltransferase
LDASLFLAELLGIGRSGLFPAEDRPLAEPVRVRYNALIERRAAGKCAAYILGRREFWGLDFTVGPAVLVPRPDTETLVEAALEALTALERPGEAPAVLDLCTGSGAVAIALKHERPSLQLYGSDISPEALAIAGINAAKLLPGEEIRFFTGDLFRALPPRPPRFALITANPPYVPSGDMAGLSREVRGEPSIALDGGGDGLDLIRRIIAGARDHLRPEGLLLMEADPRQIEAVTGILKAGGYGDIVVRRDLAGRDRVIGAYI